MAIYKVFMYLRFQIFLISLYFVFLVFPILILSQCFVCVCVHAQAHMRLGTTIGNKWRRYENELYACRELS